MQTQRSYADTVYLDSALLYWHNVISLSVFILTQYIQTDRSYLTQLTQSALIVTQCMQTQRSYADTVYSVVYSDSALLYWHSVFRLRALNLQSVFSALLYWHSIFRLIVLNTDTAVFRLSALNTETVYSDSALLYWHSVIRLSTLILTQCIQTDRSYTDTEY